MSASSRTALKLSRFLAKPNVTSRKFASLGSQSNWTSHPLNEASLSSWNSAASNMASSEQTDLILDNILSRSFPLPHANHMISVDPIQMANLSGFNGLPLSFFDPVEENETIQVMNRNARGPKKANKRSRPCSRVARRKKKDAIGKRKR